MTQAAAGSPLPPPEMSATGSAVLNSPLPETPSLPSAAPPPAQMQHPTRNAAPEAQSPPRPPESPWAPGAEQDFVSPPPREFVTPPPVQPPAGAWTTPVAPQPQSGQQHQPATPHPQFAPYLQSGAVPTLPGQPPVAPPTFEQIAAANAAAEAPAPNKRGRKLAIAGSVLGISAAALVGVAFVAGRDGTAGGADSPEAAVTDMAEALSAGDALAAVGYLAPDELSGADAFVEKLIPYLSELSDDLTDEDDRDDADGSDFDGFELEIEAVDLDVDLRGDRAAIVSFAVVGEVDVDPSGVSVLGQQMFDVSADDEFPIEFDSRTQDEYFNGSDIELVTVELDGKWYISPFLSAGHAWVEAEGLPGGEFDLVGEERSGAAATPVEAVERYYDYDSLQRASDIAEVLGGGEGRFFHVFGDALDGSGTFGDDSIGDLDQAFGGEFGFDYTLTELDDGRVEVNDIEVTFEDSYGDVITATLSDGCASMDVYGEVVSGCFDELFPSGTEVDDTLWFQTVEEDGGHRVVVLPTMFDVMSRFVGPYDADTIRWVFDIAHEDDPQAAAVGAQIDIDFDGRRYVVYEYELETAGLYSVELTGDNDYEVFTSYGDEDRFSKAWLWDGRIEAYEPSTVRLVVDSDVADNCRGFECVPSGDGTTSLTLALDDGWDSGTWDDETVGDDDWAVDENFEPLDPRTSNALVWETIDIAGPTVFTVDLPAGSFDAGTSTWTGDDISVVMDGVECATPSDYVNCSFEHAGGPIDFVIRFVDEDVVDSVDFYVYASQLDDLAVVDSATINLDGAATDTRREVTFDEVPVGSILVVAVGAEGQDVVLHVADQLRCQDVDTGFEEGEVCLIDHVGGPLTVEVGGWSDFNQYGDVLITLESN